MPNRHQLALTRWIHAGLRIPEVRKLNGDAGYILNNMIAKYSLYSDAYLVSVRAARELGRMGVTLRRPVLRGSIYGKKSHVVFEHAVPALVVRQELLRSGRSLRAVARILDQAGPVAILERGEDKLLNRNGLSRRMPDGWEWGNDVLERYLRVGIRLSQRVARMTGAIKR